MAKYTSRIGKETQGKLVSIIGSENTSHTVYVIKVNLGCYSWTVRHRYSEFHDLHLKLIGVWDVDKTLLPPKKIFGNQAKTFVEKRQQELEAYLHAVFQIHPELPEPLSKFLDFDKYEIHGITQALAIELFLQGEHLLEKDSLFELNPLQLHAMTERLKLPEPPCESGDRRKDLSHCMDFISRLKFLRITGSSVAVGTSNIVPNHLKFDLSRFKCLEHLQIINCACDTFEGIETLKKCLKQLEIHGSLNSIKEFLMCDVVHSDDVDIHSVSGWTELNDVSFRNNKISAIDETIKLIRNTRKLDLSYNQVEIVTHLSHLPLLDDLNLSHNRISVLPPLHALLGNITRLQLAGNNIESLQGIAKLYSLVNLDLSYNKISTISEIGHLISLPCLENLQLSFNPLSSIVDYRVRVLAQFGSRAKEICLDNESATQQELDTAAILQAMLNLKIAT